MTGTLSIQPAELQRWQRAAKALLETDKRTVADFNNGQAFRVATLALNYTRKADANRIARELGEVTVELHAIKPRKNQKKVSYRRVVSDVQGSLAARILLKHFRMTGHWMAAGSNLEERVKHFIASAKRSAAFIASGWVPAIKRLSSVIRQKPATGKGIGRVKVYGQPKGYAKPAVPSFFGKSFCEIQNSALLTTSRRNPGAQKDPTPIAEQALLYALDEAAIDMDNELARRLARNHASA